jgi:hypothetical protein
MPYRDGAGWLDMQDSNLDMSQPKIALKYRVNFG